MDVGQGRADPRANALKLKNDVPNTYLMRNDNGKRKSLESGLIAVQVL